MLTSRDFRERKTFLPENRNAVPKRAVPRKFCWNKDDTSGTIAVSDT